MSGSGSRGVASSVGERDGGGRGNGVIGVVGLRGVRWG